LTTVRRTTVEVTIADLVFAHAIIFNQDKAMPLLVPAPSRMVAANWAAIPTGAAVNAQLLIAIASADERRSHKEGVPTKPARQHHARRQSSSLARQISEHGLNHILSQVAVPADPPRRDRIHQVDVPGDQLAKSRLAALFRIGA